MIPENFNIFRFLRFDCAWKARSGKRKKKKAVMPKMRDMTRTSAPTYSVAQVPLFNSSCGIMKLTHERLCAPKNTGWWDQLREYAPLVKKSWGLVLAHVPWDQLGQRLYDAIFTVAPSLKVQSRRRHSASFRPHACPVTSRSKAYPFDAAGNVQQIFCCDGHQNGGHDRQHGQQPGRYDGSHL